MNRPSSPIIGPTKDDILDDRQWVLAIFTQATTVLLILPVRMIAIAISVVITVPMMMVVIPLLLAIALIVTTGS
ncbi:MULTISPECIES: hypothetical protein [unclassified Halomonas]|uniref:hypothetical protein n=1 Tax=unclassified Halomonas TaxID=2609666 RepID=UPI0028876045|nr:MULTISPECIES: hypothetical protein [unclassified Halomonas]MDT0500609.1 hypothetical protein [Halomonas sp. PAR7]MDT0511495.1 hypothetical protein [Halomonas sp. LES1]MDT0590217.1 hypothetical protein [Halomonas sp. PAR8]